MLENVGSPPPSHILEFFSVDTPSPAPTPPNLCDHTPMLRIQISIIDVDGFDDLLGEKIHHNNNKYMRKVVFNVFSVL